MKKKLYLPALFYMSCLMISCSEETIPDEPEVEETSLEILITPITETYEIDKPIEFTVTANEIMLETGITTYRISDSTGEVIPSTNSLVSLDELTGLGKEATLGASFKSPGEQTIKIHAKNQKGQLVEEELTINVGTENAVKLTFLRVASFYQKSETWDLKTTQTPPFELADFLSVLFKGTSYLSVDGTRSHHISPWYRPQRKHRGEHLFWDLSNEKLYVNISSELAFDMLGVDKTGEYQFLREFDPFSEYIDYHRLEGYIDAKPDSITITGDRGNLEVVMGLEWDL